MKKSLIVIAIILTSMYNIKAQADGIYSMYWNNRSYFNPAASGVDYRHHAYYSHHQNTWSSSDNPVSHQFAYNIKTPSLKSGFGVNYTYDKIGFSSNHNANLNYAYHINFSDENTLSFGASGGIISRKIVADWITPDGTPAIDDPAIVANSPSETNFNMKLGAYFKTDKLQIGIAADNFIRSDLFLTSIAQYTFNLSDKFSIDPSMFLRSNLNSVQLNGTILLNFKKQFWAGIGYRVSDSFSFMGGVDIKEKVRIGYAYDPTTSQLQNYSNGSHEIVLAFQLK